MIRIADRKTSVIEYACEPSAQGEAAVDRSQPDSDSGQNSGGGYLRGRPNLAGRAMVQTDDANALFFRAVDRDRRGTLRGRLAAETIDY